jgi:hypothetical protein
MHKHDHNYCNDCQKIMKYQEAEAHKIMIIVAEASDDIAQKELIGKPVNMQFLLWQNLAAWYIAGAIKMGFEYGMHPDKAAEMVDFICDKAFNMSEHMIAQPLPNGNRIN